MPTPAREEDVFEPLELLRSKPGAQPGDVPVGTLEALFIALASPDPQVRDDLAAGTLVRWIAMDRLLSDEEMRELHRQAVSLNGPLATLGDQESDTVFGRSFTILLLALLHAADNASAYLADRQWHATVTTLSRFGRNELDLRAEVPGKGWAHAIAHAADLADELAQSRHCTTAVALAALAALSTLVNRLEHPFLGEEEDRIAVAASRFVSEGYVTIADLRTLAGIDLADARELPTARRANWKAIARSLSFRLADTAARGDVDRMQQDLTTV
jgi:Protein of unknown function (DUF2785)